MYFNNLFGNQNRGAGGLSQPPDNSLASLLSQQRPRTQYTGPQIPMPSQSPMTGARMAPAPQTQPQLAQGMSSSPVASQTSLSQLLGSLNDPKSRSLLQSLGLGDLGNVSNGNQQQQQQQTAGSLGSPTAYSDQGDYGGSAANQPMLFDLGEKLRRLGLFG